MRGGLFCGSSLHSDLLGTNLGARLGFLIAGAGLSGFSRAVDHALAHDTGQRDRNSDLDPPHGNSSELEDGRARLDARSIRRSRQAGGSRQGYAGHEDLVTQVKPAIDAAVVAAAPVAGQEAKVQPFATLNISSSTDYLLAFPGSKSFQYIDKTEHFFWHRHRYAAWSCASRARDARGHS